MTAVTRLTAAQHLLPGDELLRLDSCSREPIRTPGSIQGHGVLIVVDLDTQEISHASENTGQILGLDPAGLLGGGLDAVLQRAPAAQVLAAAQDPEDPQGWRADQVRVFVNNRGFDVIEHRVGRLLLVELEPTQPVAHEKLLGLLDERISGLTAARTVKELVGEAARAIQVLTQFDKVMVYEFHEDGHGEVVADEHAEGMDNYLGLHFPASDIPAQARRLYLTNTVRSVVDSATEAVAVLARGDRQASTLDLGQAELRAVSVHHLAFMRNMGQAATLSLSLTNRDDLVGMITCAHREPRHLPYTLRRALAILARQASLQLAAIRETQRLKRQLAAHATRTTLVAQLRRQAQPVVGLTEGEVDLLSVLGADGAAAFFSGECRRIGDVASTEQSHAVARLLRQSRPEQVFVSATLGTDAPELAALVPGTAGLVFVPLGAGDDYLLWCRREVLQTVDWLGDQTVDNRPGPLSPRNSFSSWKQSVLGSSLPWDREDLTQVLELRKDINDFMLGRAQARLAHQGLHDDLTGLPNRRQAIARLTEALLPGTVAGTVAVLFVDLDRFKFINDSYGHPVGDEVICGAAARLQELIRPDDLVARLGGDEFMLAIFDTDEASATRIGQRIVEGFHRPISLRSRFFHIAVSVGLTTTRSDSTPGPLDLLREADTAMYLAKERGGAQVARFEPALRPGLRRRLELEQALSSCLQRGEIELVYQPIVAVADQRVVGAEALLRWERDGFGQVSPVEFVPILEETGLIVGVGSWVLREAIQQLATWKRSGVVAESFTLAVNLSARQFSDPGLIHNINRLISQHGLSPGELTMEITETSAMSERPEIVAAVRDLAALGVGLAIDDFGTGYSSMPMLRSLPVTQLKIDRQSVAEMTSGHHEDALVAAMVGLAHQFDLSCVAEGVENADQLDRLRGLGCDFAQGFHLGHPVSPAEFARTYRPALGPDPLELSLP